MPCPIPSSGARGWRCDLERYEEIDVRPYFPIHSDDKESRFDCAMFFYLPLPVGVAWAIAAATTISGLFLALGLATRLAVASFALLVAFLTVADRLEAFTVTKLAPVLTIALFFAPSGVLCALGNALSRDDCVTCRGAVEPIHRSAQAPGCSKFGARVNSGISAPTT
jgi:hypothetical protein